MTDTNTANDDEQLAIDLNVGGDDPVASAKAMLAGYDLNGDISRVSVRVFEPATAAPDADDTDTDSGSGGRLTEDDRKLKGVQPGSSHHLVLAAVDAADQDMVSAIDLADHMPAPDRNNISTVLSKLWRRRLLNRETGSRPYTYGITPHGEAELDEHGRDVVPDAVGGVWVDD